MYYVIENNIIVGKSSRPINTNLTVIKSNEEWDVRDAYIDGVFIPRADYESSQKSNDELFNEEMDGLNVEYDKNMSILANKYNIAVARDGSQETAKVESARAEISTLDEQYESDQLAIFNKYYGA